MKRREPVGMHSSELEHAMGAMGPSAIHAVLEYGSATVAYDNEILRTVVGSGVHGIAIEGTDDHDEMGVFIEPRDMVIGLTKPQDHYVARTQPEGHRSGPGDTDLVIYSLRKYLRLAVKGNPTALLPLFAPPSAVLISTDAGRALRDARSLFLSQEAAERFLGYMHGQHERMMGGGRRSAVPNRPELIEKYGYDVKYASHALRLAYQGHELITTGRLTLPMPGLLRSRVLHVKTGGRTREDVSEEISGVEEDCRRLLDTGATVLPPHPDTAALSALSEDLHISHWFQTR